MPSLNEIRSVFLDFFGANDHEIVASAPLIPQSDPSLLFVNSGMVPFKPYFTGAETPPHRRVTSCQRSVRAGGKHNDLDNVGYTARHLTLFEMLGNFSFGDYFKEQAIDYAWQVFHREFGIPRDKILVTVFHQDDDAFNLWRKIAGLPEDRIIRIATSDNFWSMADTGPCGPCSEIFYDHGPGIPGGPPGSPDEDGDRFIEIWNLVFMQYDQQADGSLVPLPKPSIDTGMGLERLTAVLQGVHDNYDIDLFRMLIDASVELTGVPAAGDARASHRVIADHLRSCAFLIADGVTPSNDGRGYVLRRIMRRAMRHAYLLGAQEPLIWRLVPVLTAAMGAAYPELIRGEATIRETLRQEEERFRRTLGRGLNLLDQEIAALGGKDVIPGEAAFRLYDTYGFPLDLTQDAVRPRGLTVDIEGFDAAMQRQRDQARANWTGSGDRADQAEWVALRERFGQTEFVGYDESDADGIVLAIVHDGAAIETAGDGETIDVLLDRTPLYAESGGQSSDQGFIAWEGGTGTLRAVQKRAGDLYVHTITVQSGELALGDTIHLSQDAAGRVRTRANHSGAHLLHAALRNVLGPHVTQKGQMVDAERLRFDFSHGAPLSPEEIDRIESEVNAVIRQNAPARTELMSPQAAIENGAMALFGEKYGATVRVLTLGHALAGDGPYSVELCGGTHVTRTGDIALFKIVAESGIAAGVRRIEALTGEAARQYMLDRLAIAERVAARFKTPVADLPSRADALMLDRRRLERELEDAKRQLALGGPGGGGAAAIEDIAGVQFVSRVIDGADAKALGQVADDLLATLQSGVAVAVGLNDGKVSITVSVTPNRTERLPAGELVKAAVAVMGGQGGGRPNFARGGAPDGTKVAEGLDEIRAYIARA